MGLLPVLLLPAGAWVSYAWVPQLALPFISSFKGDKSREVVHLTFDDGPDENHTPQLLDILAEQGVHATFFLIGERARKNPSIVRRMADEGHEVGNHTWHHKNAWFLMPRETEEEILVGREILEDISGKSVVLYRPPWCIVNACVLYIILKHRLETVLASIQPEGLRPRSSADQFAHCTSRLHPGAIIDLHDADGVPGAPIRLLGYIRNLIQDIRSQGFGITLFKPKIFQ